MSITSKTTCLICKDDASDDPFVTVGRKGLDTLIHYSQLCNNESLKEELTKIDTLTVHVACRHDYINPKRKLVKCATESPQKKKIAFSKFFFTQVLLSKFLIYSSCR